MRNMIRSLPARLSSWTSFSGCPIVGLCHLGDFLAKPVSRSQSRVRRISLAGHPFTGGHYLVAHLAADNQSATVLRSTDRPFGQLAYRRLSDPGTFLAEHQPVTAQVGFLVNNLLRLSVRRPLSPWRIPCGTLASRSQVHLRPVSLAGHRLISGRYLGAALSGCRPVGNGSAFRQASLRIPGSSADCQMVSHPLRKTTVTASSAPLLDFLLRMSACRPQHLGEFLAKPVSRSLSHVRQVSLAGHLRTSGRRLGVHLSACWPVGSGFCFPPSILADIWLISRSAFLPGRPSQAIHVSASSHLGVSLAGP